MPPRPRSYSLTGDQQRDLVRLRKIRDVIPPTKDKLADLIAERDGLLLRLRQEGVPVVQELAPASGLGHQRIYQMQLEAGYSVRPRARKPSAAEEAMPSRRELYDANREASVRALRDQGESIAAIAERLDMTPYRVKKALDS